MGGKMACVWFSAPTLHLCPLQLQAALVFHTLLGLCFLLGYYTLSGPLRTQIFAQIFGFTVLLMESLLRTLLLPMTIVAPWHRQYRPHPAQKGPQDLHKSRRSCAHNHSHHSDHAFRACQVAPSSKGWSLRCLCPRCWLPCLLGLL